MAALNFCSTVLKTTAGSDKVTVDGYEASNLVTNPAFVFSAKGFLVENFIRSPANITFEFACSIEIERVVIHGVVGSQRACGFEIFTQTQPKSGQLLLEKADAQSSKSETNRGKKMDEGVFVSVGKFNKLDAETFTFKNNQFRPRQPYSQLAPMYQRQFDRTKHVEAELRARHIANLTRVSHLTIRVNRVVPGCVAAVRWVEIWGQPSLSTPKNIVSIILNIHSKLINCDHGHNIFNIKSKSKTTLSTPHVPVVDETKVKIPNDFLDAITCEIMMIPILLPSGYSVDQTTLEKHNREQAFWGRPPNDPFTGKSFTDHSKPVVNAALKVRIDQFLLKYGEDLQVNSRVLGTKRDVISGAAVSSILGNQKPGPDTDAEPKTECPSVPYYLPGVYGNNVNARVASKRKRKASPKETTGTSKRQCLTASSAIPLVDLTGETSSGDHNASSGRHSRNDHERNLSATLDDALDSALSALPSFTSSSSTTVSKPTGTAANSNSCFKCNKQFEINSAYQLPCKHNVCRNCITAERGLEIDCPTCGKLFTKSSVIRVHL